MIAPVKDGAISESLFSTRDQAVHSSHRRAINTVFSMTSVLRYEPYLDETTELFFNRLEAISRNTEWIDLPSLFQYYAFDAIGMLAYGKRYGFVEKNADIDGIIKSTRMILDYTSYVTRLLPSPKQQRTKYLLIVSVCRLAIFLCWTKQPSKIRLCSS